MIDYTGAFEKVAAGHSLKGIPAKYVKIPGNLHTGIPGVGKKPNLSRDLPQGKLALRRAKMDAIARYEQETGRSLMEMQGGKGLPKAKPTLPEIPKWMNRK